MTSMTDSRPGNTTADTFPQPEAPENYNQMRPPPSVAPEVVTSFPRLFAGTL